MAREPTVCKQSGPAEPWRAHIKPAGTGANERGLHDLRRPGRGAHLCGRHNEHPYGGRFLCGRCHQPLVVRLCVYK